MAAAHRFPGFYRDKNRSRRPCNLNIVSFIVDFNLSVIHFKLQFLILIKRWFF